MSGLKRKKQILEKQLGDAKVGKEESEEKLPMIPIDNIVLGINKDIVRCNLCREDFEQIYVHDQELLYKKHLKYGELKEGWYLKNAIWSGSEVIHPTCSNC